jgi:hypothetical protein
LRIGLAVAASVGALALAGCQRTVNMAAVQKPGWSATTIPYAGVREENRQYADYSIISASVLTGAGGDAGKAAPAPGGSSNKKKSGAPR